MIYNKESNSDITSDFTVMKFNKEIAKKGLMQEYIYSLYIEGTSG